MHLRIVTELDQAILKDLIDEEPDLVIFSDIGSGYASFMNGIPSDVKVLVLDHHPPSGRSNRPIIQVNPHDHGIDGSSDVSAAGVAYLVARATSEQNMDLSTLGVVGALGDMQDRNSDRALKSVNASIAEEGIRAGQLSVVNDILLFGRETRPIHRALAHTTVPFLAKLTGSEENCLALLSAAGIPAKEGPRWRTLAELTLEEKRALLSAIIEHLMASGFRGSSALSLIGTVYTLSKEKHGTATRDAREYSSLLNGCGRMGKNGPAVAVCLGDRGTGLEEAQKIITDYRRTLARHMEWITSTPGVVQELGFMCVVKGADTIEENLTGALSSIISSVGHFRNDKATVVLARAKDAGIKISARAPEALLRRGVHLGRALNMLCQKYGGIGGGHDVAAGAHIPDTRIDDALAVLDHLISMQTEGQG